MPELPRFRAGKDKAPRMVNVGERHGETMAVASPKSPKRWYPTVRIRKQVKGLGNVGKTKTVKMKVRVNSLEMRDGSEPEVGLEIHEIGE